MSPGAIGGITILGSFPRMRGDEPGRNFSVDSAALFSPYARG